MSDTIEQLDALHAATTQGEWTNRWRGTVTIDSGYIANCDVAGGSNKQHQNSVFIAVIHNAWPEISEELKRLRDENQELTDESQRLQESLQELHDFSDVIDGAYYKRSRQARDNSMELLETIRESKSAK